MYISTAIYALTYYATGFVLMPYLFILINKPLGFPVYHNNLYIQALGISLIIIGVINSLYCYALFFEKGQGTPVPSQPTKKLIQDDIYRFTRNPLYLGHFLIIFGEFLWLGYASLSLYLVIFIVYMNLYVAREEAGLTARFGHEYEAYCQKVPRFLVK